MAIMIMKLYSSSNYDYGLESKEFGLCGNLALEIFDVALTHCLFLPGWIRVHKLTAYHSGTQTWRSRITANHSKLYPLHGATPVQPWPHP